MSWHDAALGACFQLGLDGDTICCDLLISYFPLIELINLILFLNDSYFEIEEVREIPSLVIPLQLERATSPQLNPRREPPHTVPTARTACPAPNIPKLSQALPSSSALSATLGSLKPAVRREINATVHCSLKPAAVRGGNQAHRS